MLTKICSAVACANIAFIKYWGNRDETLRLPVNGSISMNLDGLVVKTTVTPDHLRMEDVLIINQQRVFGEALTRLSRFLNIVRNMAQREWFAEVKSEMEFPAGTGIASSAAAYAALSLAATNAFGLSLSEKELSILARKGSGSACRSIPSGFTEWNIGINDHDSFASQIASPAYWNLVDCVAVISITPKKVSSTQGHAIAHTSIYQNSRIENAPQRLALCRKAILERDFSLLSEIVELDCNLMHAVMMTSNPALFYWEPTSLALMKEIQYWREQENWPTCYTLDAGPTVHVLTLSPFAFLVKERLENIPGVQKVYIAKAGPGAALIGENDFAGSQYN